MRPSLLLAQKRDEALALLAQGGAANPRLFGSVLRGTDGPGSDIDILVDGPVGASLAWSEALAEQLSELLGAPVDVLTESGMAQKLRGHVPQEARPLTPDLPLPAMVTAETLERQARMEEKRLQDYLEDMRKAANDAMRIAQDMDWPHFKDDEVKQGYIVWRMVNLGEAVASILRRFPAYAQARSHIPWHQIRNMRNRMVHDYQHIDAEKVWDAVQEDLPELVRQLSIDG